MKAINKWLKKFGKGSGWTVGQKMLKENWKQKMMHLGGQTHLAKGNGQMIKIVNIVC